MTTQRTARRTAHDNALLRSNSASDEFYALIVDYGESEKVKAGVTVRAHRPAATALAAPSAAPRRPVFANECCGKRTGRGLRRVPLSL